MQDFMDDEKMVDEIIEQNKVLLNDFEKWLKAKGLTDKTILKHVQNIEFFINDYLNYYEPTPASEGIGGVSWFLGDWFIRKAMWSNKTSILSYIASFKKFYEYMYEINEIDQEDLIFLKNTIAEEKEEWIEGVESYNDF